MVGFVSTEHSSPRRGTPHPPPPPSPLFQVQVTCRQTTLPRGRQLRRGSGCGLDVFCICMRTVTRNTYPVLYIETRFGSNACIYTICVSEVL